MADIFVSYSREDQWRVQPLVEALEQEGFTVWWDGEIDPGHQFDESIDQEIQQASCVVVAWSETSIGSRWVRNEALEGMDRGILVPVLLDSVRLPVAFKSDQTADFTNWPTSVDEGQYEHLIRAINVLTGRQADARQSPRTLDALKIRGHRRYRRKRDWLVPSLVIAVVALAIALVLLPRDVSETAGVSLTVDQFDSSEGSGDYAESLSYEIQRQLATVDGIDLVQVGSLWDFEVLPVSVNSLSTVADFVLSASVSSTSDRFAVDASLQDTETETMIWSERFEAPADDVLTVQKQLLAAVMNELKLASGRSGSIGLSTNDKLAFRDYLIGQDLLRRGEEQYVKEAITRFQRAVERDGDFFLALAAMCRARLELFRTTRDAGVYAEAIDQCEQLLELDADNAEIHSALGELYRARGESEDAKTHYLEALEISPDYADAKMGLAAILMEEGESQRAEEFYIGATRSNPTYWKAHNALAIFYFRSGMYNRAIETFLRVTQLMPENVAAFSNLGAARLYAGNFDGAFEAWKGANAIDSNSETLSNMGTALYHADRLDEAVAHFIASIELDPDDHRLWGNAADVMSLIPGRDSQSKDLYRSAIDRAEKVVDVNPDDAFTLSRLAVYYAAIGSIEKARRMVTRSESLAGIDLTVLYDLSVASKLLGDLDAAKDYKERALAAGYPSVLLEADPQFR